MLPEFVVDANSVAIFQCRLQVLVRYLPAAGCSLWMGCLSRLCPVSTSILTAVTADALTSFPTMVPLLRSRRRLVSAMAARGEGNPAYQETPA